MRLRSWHGDLVASVLDPTPRAQRNRGMDMPRQVDVVGRAGHLYDLTLVEEGASIVVAATDERQAGIVFGTARHMVEVHEDVASRRQVYKDCLYVPRRASFVCLPAALKRLDDTLAILVEGGVATATFPRL